MYIVYPERDLETLVSRKAQTNKQSYQPSKQKQKLYILRLSNYYKLSTKQAHSHTILQRLI